VWIDKRGLLFFFLVFPLCPFRLFWFKVANVPIVPSNGGWSFLSDYLMSTVAEIRFHAYFSFLMYLMPWYLVFPQVRVVP
jgi:hypothetical protein